MKNTIKNTFQQWAAATGRRSVVALLSLSALVNLSACGPSPTEPMTAYPSAAPTAEPHGGLSSLLTGSVISEEEAQLRDQLKRRVLLDFPVRVGVLFYDFQTELELSDREKLFDQFSAGIEETGLVRETVEIPQSLIQGRPNLAQLRQLGARFQTDILILVNGRHEAPVTFSQYDFWGNVEHFSESKINYQAIALDVFTGTLLSPLSASAKGEMQPLNEGDPEKATAMYEYRKALEAQVWAELQADAVKRLNQLSEDVAALKAQPENVQLEEQDVLAAHTELSTHSAHAAPPPQNEENQG